MSATPNCLFHHLPLAFLLLAWGGEHCLADGTGDPALTPSEWKSIRAAYENAQHAFVARDSGDHAARNLVQRWHTTFDGRGFTAVPDQGSWRWGLELREYGFAGREIPVAEAAGRSRADRLSYPRDEVLEEWFVNDGRGLEQGWTLSRRPDGDAAADDGPLRLTLAVRGGLSAEVSETVVRFVDGHGNAAVTYGGLKAWDADGRGLRAWFAATEEGFAVEVDERGARYPVVIDPIAQQAYLKASNTGDNDRFGAAVAVSGNVVVVGAPQEDSAATTVNGDQAGNGATESGAAYVFARTGNLWSQQAYLKASNGEAGDRFGTSVAVNGNTVVVGAPHHEAAQAAFTTFLGFEFDDNDLVFTAKPGTAGNLISVTYVNLGASQSLSVSVTGLAITVNLATDAGMAVTTTAADITAAIQANGAANALVTVTNAPGNDGTGVVVGMSQRFLVGSGAAYVFVRKGTVWTQQAFLKASNADARDLFGNAVSVSGNTILVGAPGEASESTSVNGDPFDNSAIDSGAAYVFTRATTGNWTQQAYLKASNTNVGDNFGWSVSVSGDRTIVGAYREASAADGVDGDENDNSSSFNGAAFVFSRTGTTWTKEAYLKGPNSDSSDMFGWSVAISGDLAVVGALFEASAATSINGDSADNNAAASGAAFVFERRGGQWVQDAYLKALDSTSHQRFGFSVGMSGVTVVVGAHFKNTERGKAYVFSRPGATWSEQASLEAAAQGDFDHFGFSVGVSGDTVVVGADTEDSHATGINGNGANDDAGNSGAAYVYTGVWPFYPSMAKSGHSAPGADDLAYGRTLHTAVSDMSAVLFSNRLAGAGAPLGREIALFSTLGPTGGTDLLLQKADDLSGLAATGYLPGTRVTALFAPSVNQQTFGGLFQAVVAGPGIGAFNNRALLRDDGVYLRLVRRTGQPVTEMTGTPEPGAFGEVLQSLEFDLVTVSHRLRQSTVTGVSATNDTGLLILNHVGTLLAAIPPREGDAAYGGGGNFGQFTGLASASQSNVIHFTAALLPGAGPAQQGVFHITANGATTGRSALQGTAAEGAAPGTFRLFPAVGENGGDAVFRATLNGVPVASNEGVWRAGTPDLLLLRKGVEFDAVNFPGLRVTRILRCWLAGPDQNVFHVVLAGPGVSSTNQVALLLRQANGRFLSLVRTGDVAPGVGLSAARVAAIQAVEVDPIHGRYAVLGSLRGVPASANQALWAGSTQLGDDTTSRHHRLPSLRLQKGQVYHSERTPRDIIRGLTLRPAADRSGMGGRGLGQAVAKQGQILIGIVGDRKAEELILILP